MSSDSDDDIFTNFTAKRQQKLLTKKKLDREKLIIKEDHEIIFMSSDDDGLDIKKPKIDSGISLEGTSSEKKYTSYNEYLEQKKENIRKEYKEQLNKFSNSPVTRRSLINKHPIIETIEIDKNSDLTNNSSYITIDDEEDEDTTTRLILKIYDMESGGETTTISKLESDTIADIYESFSQKWNVHVSQVQIRYDGALISPDDILSTIDSIKQVTLPNLYAFKSIELNTDEIITVKVQLQNRKKPLHLGIKPTTSLYDLKSLIINELKKEDKMIKKKKMNIMFDDEYLKDDLKTCQEYGIEDDDCVDVFLC